MWFVQETFKSPSKFPPTLIWKVTTRFLHGRLIQRKSHLSMKVLWQHSHYLLWTRRRRLHKTPNLFGVEPRVKTKAEWQRWESRAAWGPAPLGAEHISTDVMCLLFLLFTGAPSCLQRFQSSFHQAACEFLWSGSIILRPRKDLSTFVYFSVNPFILCELLSEPKEEADTDIRINVHFYSYYSFNKNNMFYYD